MSEVKLGSGHVEPTSLPTGWEAARLGDVVQVVQGGRLGLTKEKHYTSYGFPAFSASGQDGFVDVAEFKSQPAVVLSAIGAQCGKCFYADGDWTSLANVQLLLPKPRIHPRFLFHRVNIDGYWERSGSAQPFIKPSSIKNSWIAFPTNVEAQAAIAKAIDAVGSPTLLSEALIAKQERIRAGLLQDLFTRGVDENGALRPPREEAPDLYHQTELGWLPKGWKVRPLGSMAESVIDGPFGSHLKTEHYVLEPGVRVVRLQNIVAGGYNDADKMYVSTAHAEKLSRHIVRPNDVLIASLGDETYEVGRACVYPEGLGLAINKADCFRFRVEPSEAVPAFVALLLNQDRTRREKRRFMQGVTRQRMNLGNCKRLKIAAPAVDEQALIAQAEAAVAQTVNSLRITHDHLVMLKSALIQDLLTGRVSVAPLLQVHAA